MKEKLDEVPPPLYENDLGWSKDRMDRMGKIFDDVHEKKLSGEDALKEISALIEEVDKAIRDNPKMLGGKNIVGASAMMQQLLSAFYQWHKEL